MRSNCRARNELLERWERHYGVATAEQIARAALKPPETYVHIGSTGSRIQDIGAQAIVPLLGIESGDSFLDLFAPRRATRRRRPLRLARAPWPATCIFTGWCR